jgi:hypothetical protein
MRDTEAIARIGARPFEASSDGDLARALRQAGSLDGDDTPATAFAIVDEAIRRRLGICPTDEQVLAGLHMWRGRIVEMSAGEGKTIAAAFPAVCHALKGRRVHVVTANDYLALRDAEHLAPVYESLGLTVGAVLQHMNDDERRSAYGSDIVYGTVRELGFDFLRDNMRHSHRERVQRGLDVAIVDEADQVLIDESSTPLIISGGRSASRRSVHTADSVVREMAVLQERTTDRLARTARELPVGPEKRRVLAALFLADPENDYITQLMAGEPGLASRIRSDASDAVEFDDEQAHVDELHYLLDGERASVVPTERAPVSSSPAWAPYSTRARSKLRWSGLFRLKPGRRRAAARRTEAGPANRPEALPVQPGPPGHARPPAPAPRSGLHCR